MYHKKREIPKPICETCGRDILEKEYQYVISIVVPDNNDIQYIFFCKECFEVNSPPNIFKKLKMKAEI